VAAVLDQAGLNNRERETSQPSTPGQAGDRGLKVRHSSVVDLASQVRAREQVAPRLWSFTKLFH
jgi:hypothetical protein